MEQISIAAQMKQNKPHSVSDDLHNFSFVYHLGPAKASGAYECSFTYDLSLGSFNFLKLNNMIPVDLLRPRGKLYRTKHSVLAVHVNGAHARN